MMQNEPTTFDSDADIMASVATGDTGQMHRLFERHHRSVYHFFRRAAGRPHVAEDLTQDVFLRVFRFRSSFEPGREFRPWLFRIARNVLKDHVARSRLEIAADDDGGHARDHMPSQLRIVEARDRLAQVEAAIDSLSAEQREALVLARFHDLSYREIGEALGCTEGAVKARVFRALKAISARLDEGEADPK
jgi:RNA polymerase sigma-70 factor (ECF subfamily)